MSRYFDNELIAQIKDANDIVSVVSEHVALKKKGQNYWGCCPFHNETTEMPQNKTLGYFRDGEHACRVQFNFSFHKVFQM